MSVAPPAKLLDRLRDLESVQGVLLLTATSDAVKVLYSTYEPEDTERKARMAIATARSAGDGPNNETADSDPGFGGAVARQTGNAARSGEDASPSEGGAGRAVFSVTLPNEQFLIAKQNANYLVCFTRRSHA